MQSQRRRPDFLASGFSGYVLRTSRCFATPLLNLRVEISPMLSSGLSSCATVQVMTLPSCAGALDTLCTCKMDTVFWCSKAGQYPTGQHISYGIALPATLWTQQWVHELLVPRLGWCSGCHAACGQGQCNTATMTLFLSLFSKHPVRFRAVSFFSFFDRDGSVRFLFFWTVPVRSRFRGSADDFPSFVHQAKLR